MSEGFKNTAKAIEWRRNIVLDRLAMGQSQEAIARELHLHPSTISLDVQYLRIQSRREAKDFIKELPLMVKQSTRALNLIFVKTLEQVESTSDIKTKFQGLALLKDIERQKIELYTNPDILDSFVEAVEKRSEEQDPEQNQEQTDGIHTAEQAQPDEVEETKQQAEGTAKETSAVVDEDNE